MAFDIDTDIPELFGLIEEFRQKKDYSAPIFDEFIDWLYEKTTAIQSIRSDIEYHKERMNHYRSELANYKRSQNVNS